MTSFTPWQTGPVAPGQEVINPATPTPWFRDPLDRARSVLDERTPGAQYPDGYLGNTQSRRQRLTDPPPQARKPTDRGVHRDAALQADDYAWPDEFNLLSGVQNQLRGVRYVSPGFGPDTPAAPATDPDRIAELRKLAPSWFTGGPSMGTSVVPYA